MEITHLPPPRQARQSLVLWFCPASVVLVALTCVPSGLPGQVLSHSSESQKELYRIFDEAAAKGRREWNSQHYVDALRDYTHAQHAAHQVGDSEREARAWLSMCSCASFLHRYREAIQACNTSHALGLQVGNKTWSGGAASNLAGVYRSLGEYALSEKEGREALLLLENSPRKDFLADLLVSLADLAIEEGHLREGTAYSDRGIQVTRQAKLPDEEALLWDVRGFALMKANQLDEAAKAFQQGQAIRVDGKENKWFSVVLGHRSELEFKKGNYAEALRLNNWAYSSHSADFSDVPAYYFVHVRGQILQALNRRPEALAQFRKAMELANSWREAVMPGDSTNTQTVVYLTEVYQDFAELAAEMSLEHNDPELSRQALEALAQNRGASLREQLAASLVRDPKFSDRYFQLLSELQSAQAQVTLGNHSAQESSKLESIRLELSQLEDQSLSFSRKKENYAPKNSLKGIQSRLDRTEVLLSFCLGKTSSFLWAVTKDNVQLFKLPEASEIDHLATRFALDVKNGRAGETTGYALSKALFGSFGPSIWKESDWLITEDGSAAGSIPYAALPDLSGGRPKELLVAHHSLRLLPSEYLLLLSDTAKPQHRFVGVADPIYNLADSRRSHDVHFVAASNTPPAASLGRLVGSSLEVKSAAKLSDMPKTEVLTGSEANGSALRAALQQTPELLHFAVHVVSPEGKPQEAALALSLTQNNMPELLTRESIAVYRVPGSLVVLSGCASGQGKPLPSAGLIGLSRAWLLAGASAVVVSAWPIPDDSGTFFSAFYRHLQTVAAGSLAQRAATALQEAQIDMQHGSGFRTTPSFWAAYSILSKE